jgi:uncharacterized protein
VKVLIAFACGVLFAVGLGVSGMLQPTKVLGFLDFFGAWDPTLMGVMCGAIPVVSVAWLLRKGKPTACGGNVPDKSSQVLDARLFAGASLFGIGWALAGVCPGPAVTNLAAPSRFTLGVFAAVVAGIAASFLVPTSTASNRRTP